jgi:hypothetical protein
LQQKESNVQEEYDKVEKMIKFKETAANQRTKIKELKTKDGFGKGQDLLDSPSKQDQDSPPKKVAKLTTNNLA